MADAPEGVNNLGHCAFRTDTREIDIMAKLNTDARKKLSTKDFAEPKKRAFPVEDKAHARNAKARASQAAKAGRMSKAEEGKIDRKADAVLRKG
jgi:hypothetical protein